MNEVSCSFGKNVVNMLSGPVDILTEKVVSFLEKMYVQFDLLRAGQLPQYAIQGQRSFHAQNFWAKDIHPLLSLSQSSTSRIPPLPPFHWIILLSLSLSIPRFLLNSAKVASTPIHSFTHAKFPMLVT